MNKKEEKMNYISKENDSKNKKNKKNNLFNKQNKNKHYKKRKKIKLINGKLTLDVLDILIIILATVIISCVLTGLTLNSQYRKHISFLNNNKITSEYINDFIDVYTEVVDNFYEEVDQKGMIDSALDGMLGYLEDNYSIHLDQDQTDELNQTLDGFYNGIGILARGNVVADVYKDSPAEKTGIKVNDEIIEINDIKIDSNGGDVITDSLKKDEENKIVIKRQDKLLTFKLKLGKVYLSSTAHDVIENKKNRIGYISLSAFTVNAAADFQESLLQLEKDKKIDSLIIDLRGNKGGYLSAASNIAKIFIEKGKVIYSLDNKDGVVDYKDDTKQKYDIEVIVLVNEISASASEVLASALKDSYGAIIVGKTTFGKGTVQTTKKYGNTMVKYTSAKWLRPNGGCVDGIGINPDYEVNVELKNNTMYDKQLDKAIELLTK